MSRARRASSERRSERILRHDVAPGGGFLPSEDQNRQIVGKPWCLRVPLDRLDNV
jgi:hypothetical protein